MSHIVEKPAPDEAPSTLAVSAATCSNPRCSTTCARFRGVPAARLQLTDAIARMVPADKTFAYRYEGRRFDCGSKEGFVAATVHFARKAGYSI